MRPELRHLVRRCARDSLGTERFTLAPPRIEIFDTILHVCDGGTSADSGGVLYSYTDHVSDYAAAKIGAVLNGALVARPQ